MPKPRSQFAKSLRQCLTDAEQRVWLQLRAHRLCGAKFKRQQPLGPYIVDFVCFESRLVIEIDGGQHLDSADDRVRDAWLGARGFRVLRFWNHEVLNDLPAVLEVIAAHVRTTPPLPTPLPQGERG